MRRRRSCRRRDLLRSEIDGRLAEITFGNVEAMIVAEQVVTEIAKQITEQITEQITKQNGGISYQRP